MDRQRWPHASIGTQHRYDDYVTEKRADDWIAYVAGSRGVWEAGRIEAEALGALYIRLWREQQKGA